MLSFLVLYLFRTCILLKDRSRHFFLNDEMVESDDGIARLRELLLSECMCTSFPIQEGPQRSGYVSARYLKKPLKAWLQME